MADRTYGDYSKALRMADLRMVGVSYRLFHLRPPIDLCIDQPGMACFYYLRKGRARLVTDDGAGYDLVCGTAVGVEDGRAHRWLSIGDGDDGAVELLAGVVDRRHTIIQKLMNVLILLPPDAAPFATVVRHCVEAMVADMESPHPSEAVARRFSEIIQLEMLHYADARLEEVAPIPDGIRYDAPLLRAWTAFLNDPAHPWTVASLAVVAGISRTAFSVRFTRIIGAPPLATLRSLRVRYAADMLRTSQAPVAEIALRVGYGSDIALLRAFRQELGTTPARWRAQTQAVPSIPADR